jgi:hypothetical protein
MIRQAQIFHAPAQHINAIWPPRHCDVKTTGQAATAQLPRPPFSSSALVVSHLSSHLLLDKHLSIYPVFYIDIVIRDS